MNAFDFFGTARVSRAVLGVLAQNIPFSRTAIRQKEVFGETPKTTREKRALP